jgi:hypothetical protein
MHYCQKPKKVTTLDFYAVIHLARSFIMSLNGKYCALMT